jgi:hypothetical protein
MTAAMPCTPQPQQARTLLAVMWTGLVLSAWAAVYPFVDRVTTHRLADHIRAGYPEYTQARVDSAVSTYLILLSVIGALGVIAWFGTIRAVMAGNRWACPTATVMLVLGASIGATAMFTKDTSGETGLPTELGFVEMAPSVAGAVAVALLWRRPRST